MKAFIASHYGTASDLVLSEVPTPEPGPVEILIAVEATTVNRTDEATLRAHPWFARPMTGLLRPRDPVFGMDFAGTVVATGTRVTRFQVDDRVFGLSSEHFGAHAEFLCLPETGAIARIPGALPAEQAVVCEGAWYADGSVGTLTEDANILIYGASGAIGTAAVQLARARGARVTAVVGPQHLELAQILGAQHILDYTAEDFTQTQDRFDVVFDAVGKTSYFACRHLLKPNGVYRATDLGPYWSNIGLGLWSAISKSGRVSIPFPEDAPGFVARLKRLMESGQFRGVFDRIFPFADIPDAYRYVSTGRKTGIVVISLAPDSRRSTVFGQ